MSEPQQSTRAPGGCALVLGVLLIALGVLFLAQNLLGWSLLIFLRRGLMLFADYWPVLLVGWGVFKIYERFTAPERARVSAGEVVLLLLLVGTGLTLRAARRVMAEFSSEAPFDELLDLAELEELAGPAHRFTEESSFDLGTASSLVVENAEGSVTIVGRAGSPGNEDARVEAVLVKRVRDASESAAEERAADVKLDFQAGGERPRLTVALGKDRGRIETDLKLTLPEGCSLTLGNRRGPVVVSGLAGRVEIETSQGEIEAENLRGGLRARTSHAPIRARGLSGGVELRNRHGEIDARNIEGDLTAETGNASIVVEDVQGTVVLENRNASIRAARVGGGLEIRAENTEIAVEDAKAAVSIQTSNEPVFVRGVAGGLNITSRGAVIQARDVGGDVDITAEHEPVTVSKVAGAVKVHSRPSEVTADDVLGALEIDGSEDRVRVSNFGSSLSVRSSHAELRIATESLSGAVSLETTYGDVEMDLPPDSSARIVARTGDGDLDSEVEGLDLQEGSDGSGRKWEGTLGSGSHSVTLATSHGDIRLKVSTR
jgi:DUF4097 and DUF4098 domain-containing protein YvlB